MSNDIKQNIAESSIWKRGLYMFLFTIFYSVAEVVLFVVVIFQFFLKLFTGETNPRLLKLGQSLATYIYQIVQFLNFNSEHLPYPLSGWPRTEPRDVKQKPAIEREGDLGSNASEPVVKDVADGAGQQDKA